MKKIIENNALFIHKSLNGLADSLIKVFIPIIILNKTGNLYLCLLFMILRPVFFILFNNIFKKLLRSRPSLSIFLHIVPMIIIQFLVFFVNLTLPIVLLLSVLMGLFNAFYSIPINLLFVFSDKKLNVSKMEIGTNISKILFILLSGFIINSGSITYIIVLCVAASLLYILSVLPLTFGNRLVKEYVKNEKEENKKEPLSKGEKRLFNLVHLLFGSFQFFIDEILPVYLFFIGVNFANIAIMHAAIEFGKIISNFSANYFYSKNISNISIMIFCGIYSALSISMIFINNLIIVYVFSVLIGITFPFIFVPIFKKFCELIKGKAYTMDEVKRRDDYVFAGRPVVASSYFIGFTFITPFIFAGLISVALAAFSLKLLKSP